MSLFEVFVLALVEGATEFLPVSSTGHLIVTSAFLGISEEGFAKSFNIIIQFGAILSVLFLYWRRFIPPSLKQAVQFYQRIFVAFLPAAVIGLLVKDKIDLVLGSPTVVAVAFIVGGILLIKSDRWFANQYDQGKDIGQLSLRDCLLIGLIQCLAFIPGTSRSAATILGGLLLGMQRKEAAEFSFFLAVPTLSGAALIKTLGLLRGKDGGLSGTDSLLTNDQIWALGLGTVFAFIFAAIAIRFFIALVSRFGFKHFGYYRIVLGLFILAIAIPEL